jgi:hypothetical protein
MNSLTLKENGFAEFVPLKGLPFSSLPYNQSSVLVLVDSSLAGQSTSDILYIGRTKRLTKRVFGGYLAGYGGKTTRKINTRLFDEGYLEKVAVGWMLTENPKTSQQQLLDSFKKEYGQYPAWNAPKKNSKPAPAKPKPQASKPAKARVPRKSAAKPAA